MVMTIDYGRPSHFAFGGRESGIDVKMSSSATKNVPSKYLTPEENENVFRALGESCTSMGSGMAQLMIAEGERWSTVRIGVACYVRNYDRKIVTIAIVDPGYERRKPSVLTDINIGPTVSFVQLTKSFVAFEADSTKYALNFAVEDEAQLFFQTADILQTRRRLQLQKKQNAEPSDTLAPVKDDLPSDKAKDGHKREKKQRERKHTIWGWLKHGDSKKKKLTTEDISKPTDSKHTMHYGADGSFLAKEAGLDPNVTELFNHICHDLDGNGNKEHVNKKILAKAVKHLGEDEIRKIVLEQAEKKPKPPKIALPETPEDPKPRRSSDLALRESPRRSAVGSNSSFVRSPGRPLDDDWNTPGIPLIHSRNSIRLSKEKYHTRNTVNAVKKYQDKMSNSNGTMSPNFAPPVLPVRDSSNAQLPAPPPARNESLRKPSAPLPPSSSRKPAPSAPPPPLPLEKPASQVKLRVTEPATPKAVKPAKLTAGVTLKSDVSAASQTKDYPKTSKAPPPPSVPSSSASSASVAAVVAGPPAPPPPPPPPPPPAPPSASFDQVPPKTPKNVPAEVNSPDRKNLMNEIVQGKKLRKVVVGEESPTAETPTESGNSIMNAIAKKLEEMRPNIGPDSDSEEEDDSDDWDES
ncbi:hypothetical protein L596_024238 [Steinernema carpocapsae]|uniref:WH1 domain-containing protein n=1 Tax=Steinernema carpocapsae TaxID=34508 RepID=A0A4U5MG59_STECR|nr:hypothetical protein L596_024238 [Steinernema carpocapsae]